MSKLDEYFSRLFALLQPGGRVLNHAISRPWRADRRARFARRGFIDRFVFPDGELLEVGSVVTAIQRAGFEVAPRREPARALRTDASRVVGQSRTRLGGRGRRCRRGESAHLAPVRRGVGPQLRGRQHAGAPGPRGEGRRRPFGYGAAPDVLSPAGQASTRCRPDTLARCSEAKTPTASVVLTLDRPEALNAFNEALYDAVSDALAAAARRPVGRRRGAHGRRTSVLRRGRPARDGANAWPIPTFVPGRHGFPGFIERLLAFEKPLLLAINGLGLGIGVTMIGFSDLVFMSSTARLRCPFTDLGVAPEAGSSYTFPTLLGRQRAAWTLLSSEWLSAEECRDLGLVFRVCAPDELLDTTMAHARLLAAKPISSLRATKRLMTAHHRDAVGAARAAEDDAFQVLMAGPANKEALAAFAEKRRARLHEPVFPPGW